MQAADSRRQTAKLLIGLTGGIGSGKTSVAKIIEKQGFPVCNSDIRAKEIVNDNAELKTKILAKVFTLTRIINNCL